MSTTHLAFGSLGLFLMAFGAVLPELVGTWAFTLLLLPSGVLLCGGVGLLQRDRPLSTGVVTGMALVVLGTLAVAGLAVVTPELFLGLRTAGHRRALRFPIWTDLLSLYVGWTIAAILAAVGLRIITGRGLERSIAVGLALFAVFPAIGALLYFLDLLFH